MQTSARSISRQTIVCALAEDDKASKIRRLDSRNAENLVNFFIFKSGRPEAIQGPKTRAKNSTKPTLNVKQGLALSLYRP